MEIERKKIKNKNTKQADDTKQGKEGIILARQSSKWLSHFCTRRWGGLNEFLASLTFCQLCRKSLNQPLQHEQISQGWHVFVYTHRCQLAAAEAGLALQHEETSSPGLLILPPSLSRAEYTWRELHKWGTVEPGLLIFRAGNVPKVTLLICLEIN